MKSADVIIRSKNIFTSTTKETLDGAIAISGNIIVYVGSNDGTQKLEGLNTKILNFGDQAITPGFIDAHCHIQMTSLMLAGEIFFSDANSEEATVAELANSDYAKAKKPGEWLYCFGWYLPFWENKTLPTKATLDARFPNNPVLMSSGDGHCIWINTMAMNILGIDENTPVPAGGKHEKDKNGELTGVFHETANLVISSEIFDLTDKEVLKKRYKDTLNYAISKGNTGICDVSMMPVEHNHDGIHEEIYQELMDEDNLNIRVNLYPEITESMKRINEFKNFINTDMLRVAGVKQFFDGVSGTHTAWQTEPYTSAFFEGDCGLPTVAPELMEKLVLLAHKNNFSIRIHAIGDASVHSALNSFEKAYKKYGRKPDLQHTLEHVESILVEDFVRMKDLGILVSAQPGHALIDPTGIENDLGLDRSKLMWAFRRFIDDGTSLALGTDAPIIDMNPLLSVYYAVTRESVEGQPVGGWEPEQKITLPEAIIVHTLGSAKACTMDKKVGTLEVGKLADIVVFDRNIFSVPIKELLETNISLTMVDGKKVYEA